MIVIYRPAPASMGALAIRGLIVLLFAVIALIVLGVSPELSLAFGAGAALWVLRLTATDALACPQSRVING